MPAVTGGGDLYLTDLSPGDKPWDSHRENAGVVQTLYQEADLLKYANRISDCSRLLGFALKAEDSGELKIRLQEARFCRVRHCPVCQWRRSLMWRARFFQAVPKIMEDFKTEQWLFLTLTVKNCPVTELRSQLVAMNRAWRRLTKRTDFPGIGFVRSTEVTRAYDCFDGSKFVGRHGSKWIAERQRRRKRKLRIEPTDETHPHFHALLLVPASYFSHGYIPHARWQELWKESLRVDYTPVVNVKAVKPVKGEDNPRKAIALGVLETLKYGVKEDDLMSDSAWLAELTTQLHKTRAVSTGGVLKKYLKADEPEDLIHAEESPPEESNSDVSMWFGWRELVKRYAKVEP